MLPPTGPQPPTRWPPTSSTASAPTSSRPTRASSSREPSGPPSSLTVACVFLEALAQAHSRQVGGVSGALLDKERDLLAYLRGLDASIHKENTKTPDRRNVNLVQYLYEQRQKKEAELARLVQRMRRKHPQYAALQYPRPCTLREARDCLDANEVAILFALDDKQSWAVVVQKHPPR
jgi:hypothetical protein